MISTITLEWMRLLPELALKWVLVLAVLSFVVIFLLLCQRGKIDLSHLLDDPALGNKASLSRFQLLLSTFVIVGCYLAITLTNPPENGILYDIPNGLLVFFGISGGSFLVSKSLSSSQASAMSSSAQGSAAPPSPQPSGGPARVS